MTALADEGRCVCGLRCEGAGCGPGAVPLVVTLCGSMRFYRHMLAVAAERTAAGEIVLAPFVTIAPDRQAGADVDLKARLDRLHRDKIARSDAVIVVSDVTGYFGSSTAGEIEYAYALGLPVSFREVESVGYCCSAAHDAALVANGWSPDTIDAADGVTS